MRWKQRRRSSRDWCCDTLFVLSILLSSPRSPCSASLVCACICSVRVHFVGSALGHAPYPSLNIIPEALMQWQVQNLCATPSRLPAPSNG